MKDGQRGRGESLMCIQKKHVIDSCDLKPIFHLVFNKLEVESFFSEKLPLLCNQTVDSHARPLIKRIVNATDGLVLERGCSVFGRKMQGNVVGYIEGIWFVQLMAAITRL